jgi:imidazolonepropionase-like amidohydrolase
VEARSEYTVIADSILTDRGLVPDRALKIKDGCIEDINSVQSVRSTGPVLDFTGYTVSPFFCDFHLHFFERNPYKDKNITNTFAAYGISEVYDGGARDIQNLEAKGTGKNQLIIRRAGCALYRKGTYGNYIGKGVSDIQGAEKLINRLIQFGADYIKVINSGVFRPDKDDISVGGFDFHELKHIVTYAKAAGLDVFCHANGEKAVREAVDAGVSSIIHGLRISSETLSLMAERGISFIPTVNAFASLRKVTKNRHGELNIERAVDKHLSVINKAVDKGVHVLPGSDAGASFIPYGESHQDELLLFQKAGLPLEKILMSTVAGYFEKGKKADFLVLENLKVKSVFSCGRRILVPQSQRAIVP